MKTSQKDSIRESIKSTCDSRVIFVGRKVVGNSWVKKKVELVNFERIRTEKMNYKQGGFCNTEKFVEKSQTEQNLYNLKKSCTKLKQIFLNKLCLRKPSRNAFVFF